MVGMARRTHRLLLAFVLASIGIASALDALTGSCAGLAHALPFVLLVVPLLVGRYFGERHLARLIGALPPPSRRRAARGQPRRVYARTLPRGGCLIAHSLAVRPPPVRAPAAT